MCKSLKPWNVEFNKINSTLTGLLLPCIISILGTNNGSTGIKCNDFIPFLNKKKKINK